MVRLSAKLSTPVKSLCQPRARDRGRRWSVSALEASRRRPRRRTRPGQPRESASRSLSNAVHHAYRPSGSGSGRFRDARCTERMEVQPLQGSGTAACRHGEQGACWWQVFACAPEADVRTPQFHNIWRPYDEDCSASQLFQGLIRNVNRTREREAASRSARSGPLRAQDATMPWSDRSAQGLQYPWLVNATVLLVGELAGVSTEPVLRTD